MMKSMLIATALLGVISSSASVPVYGTARYGRPLMAYRPPAPAYYRTPYPYGPTYSDDLYYQPDIMHYSYYPVTRPYTKNDVYQSLYPYYYTDRLQPYSYYSNEDDYVPTTDMSDRDDMRTNGRADALPVGQETWYEGETVPRWQDDYDDVNAAFMKNLVAYNDALAKTSQNGKNKEQEFDRQEYYGDRDTRDFEDEDVRELKALAGKPLYHVPKTNNFDKAYKQYTTQSPIKQDDYYDYPGDEAWINWSSKRSEKKVNQKQKMLGKTTVAPPTSTTMKITTKIPSTVGGQKEEVLLRPATPVRHPFPEPVMQMLAANSIQKKRTPSVYDTIKQLLSMEEDYKPVTDNKPRMQKRFVATEEDLVGELKGLKRRSPA